MLPSSALLHTLVHGVSRMWSVTMIVANLAWGFQGSCVPPTLPFSHPRRCSVLLPAKCRSVTWTFYSPMHWLTFGSLLWGLYQYVCERFWLEGCFRLLNKNLRSEFLGRLASLFHKAAEQQKLPCPFCVLTFKIRRAKSQTCFLWYPQWGKVSQHHNK